MPIRAPAARACARRILGADADPTVIDLAASLIATAVEIDEIDVETERLRKEELIS